MKVIKIEAKVCHLSEEQMEAQETYDLGNIAKSKEWVWRKIGIEVPEIYRIEEYDKTKSIVLTYDEEKIMVREPFDDLFARWEELKSDETPFREEEEDPEEEEEISGNEEDEE